MRRTPTRNSIKRQNFIALDFVEENYRDYLERDKVEREFLLPMLKKEYQVRYNDTVWKKESKHKVKTIFTLIRDRLILSSKMLFINVVLNVPSEEYLFKRVTNTEYWDDNITIPPSVTRTATLESNSTINRFTKLLERHLTREDKQTERLGKRVYPHNLIVVWSREYGKKKNGRHYHVLIGINGQRNFSPGAYSSFPSPRGNLSEQIADCWLQALGLDEIEYANVQRKKGRLFGNLIYYPGIKKGRYNKLNIHKSRSISRVLTTEDQDWFYKVISYMLKPITKDIPESKVNKVQANERTFGCSQCIAAVL